MGVSENVETTDILRNHRYSTDTLVTPAATYLPLKKIFGVPTPESLDHGWP